MRAAPLDEYMKLTAVCEYVVTCISVLVLVAAVSEYVRLRQAAAAGVTRPASLASHGRRAERRADAAPGGGVAEVQSADQPAAVAATRHRAVREEIRGGESGDHCDVIVSVACVTPGARAMRAGVVFFNISKQLNFDIT